MMPVEDARLLRFICITCKVVNTPRNCNLYYAQEERTELELNEARGHASLLDLFNQKEREAYFVLKGANVDTTLKQGGNAITTVKEHTNY